MNPLSWSVLEFEEKDRHPDWIWYAGLVFGIGAILCFFYGNIFFGIFLIVAGAAVIMFSMRKPVMITVSFEEKELVIDRERIAYEQVRQFWIDESGKPDKLLLLVKGTFIPMVVVPLAGITAEAVRTEMKKYAPEVTMHESLGVKIADRLGF